MASFNMDNYAIASGRLVKDPVIFPNEDGSKKVRITIAAQNNYKNKETGERDAQYIPLEAFIPKERAQAGNGVYDLMHQGDKITAQYTVRNNNYTDKTTGEPVYGLTLQIENVKLDEAKSVTNARHAQRQVAADNAAAASVQ